MASIHREIGVAAPAEAVWAALRDVGNPHRLFRGVLADARLDGDVRTVVFVDGAVVRERIVAVDDDRRRVAYAVLKDGLVHHSAAMQVLADGPDRSRFAWTTDILPDALVAVFGPRIEQGLAALRATVESAAPREGS